MPPDLAPALGEPGDDAPALGGGRAPYTGTIFDPAAYTIGGAAIEELSKLSHQRARTARNAAAIAAGRHPHMNGRLRQPPGEKCGTCAHAVKRHEASTYHKCALTRAHWTRGEASDIRLKWPACERWQGIV